MYKIVIIPGHGGNDPGGSALHPTTGGMMRESKINLNVGLKLKSLLESKGFTVLISRTTDQQFLSPTEQLNFVNKSHADLAIAIHENDAAQETAKGWETYYQPNSAVSKKVATLIGEEFDKLGQEKRGVMTFNRSIAVMKAKVPTVLTEYAFLTKADVKDLDTLEEQWAQAQAICNAIVKYFGGK